VSDVVTFHASVMVRAPGPSPIRRRSAARRWARHNPPLFRVSFQRADVDGLADLFGGILLASSTSISMRACAPRPLMLKIFLPVSRSRTNSTHAGRRCSGRAPARSCPTHGRQPLRELVRETRHHHVHLVADRLQRAPAGLLTAGALWLPSENSISTNALRARWSPVRRPPPASRR